MGKKKETKVKYVGPSEAEIAAQRQQYEATLAALQQQNGLLSQQYNDTINRYNADYNTRNSLLSQQLDEQRSYYEQLLSKTNEQLASTKQLYGDLSSTQEKQAALQAAELERSSLLAQDSQKDLLTQAEQQNSTKASVSRRRTRSRLLRPPQATA